DGMQYPLVTGVQTCALPICGEDVEALVQPAANDLVRFAQGIKESSVHNSAGRWVGRGECGPVEPAAPWSWEGKSQITSDRISLRSEERRVGKVCRCRWAMRV